MGFTEPSGLLSLPRQAVVVQIGSWAPMGPEPGSACSVSGATTISSTTAGQGCWKRARSAGVICWARSEHNEAGSGSARPSASAPPVPQVPSLAEMSTRPVGQAVQGRCVAKNQVQLDQVGWHTPGDGTVENNDGKAMAAGCRRIQLRWGGYSRQGSIKFLGVGPTERAAHSSEISRLTTLPQTGLDQGVGCTP
jgi:hypothetical protein